MRPKKCVVKLLALVLLYLILLLIDVRLKKCAIKLFSKNFILKYYINRYKSQEMCSKAVDACIPELKLVPDWFGTNKMLDKFDVEMLYL